MKTNILFMQSQTFFGADSHIHSLFMRHLDRRFFKVHVACNYMDGGRKSAAAQALESIPDLHIRRTKFGASINFRSKKEIIKDILIHGIPSAMSLIGLPFYIWKNRVQVIHCTEKPRDAFYGLILAKLTGAKCVIHLHVKAEDWISPLVRWAMRHADALVGVSDFVSQSIIAMNYPPERVFCVLNGMDIQGWNPDLNGNDVHQEFNLPPDVPIFVVISRLFYWKGHGVLLKALAKLKERVPDFRLLIVGDDDPRANPGNRSYKETLQSMVEEYGLSEQVIFTGFRSDIPRLLAACDVFTMPSFEEPFGMVYLEAMAMKKPVIASDNAGAREVIEHGKSGLLSLPQDIDHLAENLYILVQDPEMRKRMGEYGRQRVEEMFNPQRMAKDMERVYRKILGSEINSNTVKSPAAPQT